MALEPNADRVHIARLALPTAHSHDRAFGDSTPVGFLVELVIEGPTEQSAVGP